MEMEAGSLMLGMVDAFDLWVIVPFLLGYFSWRLLFVGLELPSHGETGVGKKVVEEDEHDAAIAAAELASLREEIRREREQNESLSRRPSIQSNASSDASETAMK